jgi:hypothetical protein
MIVPVAELVEPTDERVTLACQEFDHENGVAERALDELFGAYPANTVEWQVLLKVVTLNRLYWTNILDVHGMAKRICESRAQIDAALNAASPEIVDLIATFGQKRIEYSFASKYCSSHRPDAYPIWDSRVRSYLLRLRRREKLKFLGTNPYLWNEYGEFVEMINGLRAHYQLACSLKDLDKFLYTHGKGTDKAAGAESGVDKLAL